MKRDFSLTHCRSLSNYDIDKTLGIELDIQHGLLLSHMMPSLGQILCLISRIIRKCERQVKREWNFPALITNITPHSQQWTIFSSPMHSIWTKTNYWKMQMKVSQKCHCGGWSSTRDDDFITSFIPYTFLLFCFKVKWRKIERERRKRGSQPHNISLSLSSLTTYTLSHTMGKFL